MNTPDLDYRINHEHIRFDKEFPYWINFEGRIQMFPNNICCLDIVRHEIWRLTPENRVFGIGEPKNYKYGVFLVINEKEILGSRRHLKKAMIFGPYRRCKKILHRIIERNEVKRTEPAGEPIFKTRKHGIKPKNYVDFYLGRKTHDKANIIPTFLTQNEHKFYHALESLRLEHISKENKWVMPRIINALRVLGLLDSDFSEWNLSKSMKSEKIRKAIWEAERE